MFCSVFVVFLLIQALQAKTLVENTYKKNVTTPGFSYRNESFFYSKASRDPSVDLRLEGSVELTEADMATLKFVAYIFLTSSGSHLGNGIVVTKFHVITLPDVVENQDATAIGVIVGDLDPSDPNRGGVVRVGKELIPHPECNVAQEPDLPNPLINCLTLIRVCPSFDPEFLAPPPVPISATFRDVATLLNIYDFKEPTTAGVTLLKPLSKITKHVGELCECQDIEFFDLDFHICVAHNPTMYADPGEDVRGLIVTTHDNSAIVGFLVKEQSSELDPPAGEIVIALGEYAQYITETAVMTPYEYPASVKRA